MLIFDLHNYTIYILDITCITVIQNGGTMSKHDRVHVFKKRSPLKSYKMLNGSKTWLNLISIADCETFV